MANDQLPKYPKSQTYPRPPGEELPFSYPLLPFPLDDKNWRSILTQLNKSGIIATQINALVPTLISAALGSAILSGTASLSAGTVTVSNVKIKSSSKCVACFVGTPPGVGPHYLATTCSNGSAAITSSSNTDTNTVVYIIIL